MFCYLLVLTYVSIKNVPIRSKAITSEWNNVLFANKTAYEKFRCAQVKVMSNDMQMQGANVLTELCSDKAYPAPRKSEILPDKVSVVTLSTSLSPFSTICWLQEWSVSGLS